MLSNDLKQIILMNPVRINYNLAKHKREDKFIHKNFEPSAGFVGSSNFFNNDDSNVWDGVPFSVRKDFRSPFWRSVTEAYIKFRLLFTKPKKDPVKFFMELKDSLIDMKESDEISDETMSEMLNRLENSKQKSAIASLMFAKNLKTTENKILKAGFPQYQTEESLIEFIKRCKKGLCLTEIEYFDRVIPDEAMDKFDKAEGLKIFDNYYILYYDKNKSNNPYTKIENKPKDPIMFGVIQGSNKLYLIADWIDEFCDLTYKDILEKGTNFKLKKQ